MEALIGDRVAGRIVVVKYGHGLKLEKTEVMRRAIPCRTMGRLNGARRIAELLQQCDKEDLIFFLLSGGGSAQLRTVRCRPKSNRSWKWQAEGLSLVDRQRTTEAQRVNIFEINAVRKHLSRVAGSWLASPGDFGASRQSRINVFGVKARRKTPPEFDMHFLRLYNTGEHRLIGGPMSTKISPRWCYGWSSFWWWFISGSALLRPQTYNRLLDSLLAYDLDERVQT